MPHVEDIDLERGETDAADALPTFFIPDSSASTCSDARSVDSVKILEKVVLKPEDVQARGKEALPGKGGTKTSRYIRYNFFTTYRKIFAVIFTANLIAFIAFVAKESGTPKATDVGSAASANLMVCILFRQENFVNLLYEIAVSAPHSLPLAIRRKLAKVFHYGGAHSGAGVAAVVWYIMYTAIATKDFVHFRSSASIANLVTSYVLVLMFIFMLVAAHPKNRVKYHDYFEAVHRYAGWTALMAFWVHSIFAAEEYRRLDIKPLSLGMYLVKSSNFWTLCISTGCSIISWGRLRRREVFPEKLSDHAIRLHFKYKVMPPFYGLKISDRPLLEWHAFATIPNKDGFSVVVSNAGDWTKKTIQNQPTKLWVRGYPMHGLLYTSLLFKKIVVVATGSGIGPCLSLMHANVTPRRILWSTPHPEATYGPKVVEDVLNADPEAVIWNTRTQGRPDMVALTYQLVLDAEAEAVFIISNPKVTRKVVYGMETRGIAAYGAIFDS